MHLSQLVRCIEFPEPTIVMTNIKILDEDGGWNMNGQYSCDCDAGRNEEGGLSHYFVCYEGYENSVNDVINWREYVLHLESSSFIPCNSLC